jgi:hypothetical protein
MAPQSLDPELRPSGYQCFIFIRGHLDPDRLFLKAKPIEGLFADVAALAQLRTLVPIQMDPPAGGKREKHPIWSLLPYPLSDSGIEPAHSGFSKLNWLPL